MTATGYPTPNINFIRRARSWRATQAAAACRRTRANLVGSIDQGRWTPGANDVYQLVDEATMVRHLRDPDTGVPRYVTY